MKPRLFTTLFLLLSLTLSQHLRAADAAQRPGIWPDPKLLDELQRKKTTWIYRESDVPPYQIPDPLVCADGTRITTKEQWEKKGRPETLELFRKYVYGRSPKPGQVSFATLTSDPKALDGRATHNRVKITITDAAKSFSFETSLLIPNTATGPVPAFILINNRPTASADPTRKQKDGFWPAEDIIAHGYATAVFETNAVDPDKADAASRAKGVRAVFNAGTPGQDAWATIAAWAWGASRVLDYLQTQPRIDSSKVAVIGHSRGGKTALWAGAEDTRFALVISNDSGCGGAALSKRIFGETVKTINRGFPYWFCDNFKKYDDREGDLPVEQNQLLALIAPRALCVGSAEADFWADQRGEFLSLAHASPVFALYGFNGLRDEEFPALDTPLIRDRVSYHIRRGVHNLTPYDWNHYMDFADRVWRKQ
jgi:hypothetical protein